MLDDFFYGIAKFEDSNSFVNLANKIGYKNSSQWRLPRWEDLKSLYPFDPKLNIPTDGFLWTDNASSASYTAKKMNLSDGSFTECRTRDDYNQTAHFRLFCKTSFDQQETQVHSSDDFTFVILPFGKMTFEEVDKLNALLGNISYLGFNQFIRPTIEQLKVIQPLMQNIITDEQSWFWSSSEGGRFNAYLINMASAETYACKKSSDYSTNQAFSLAIVG